MNAQYFSGSQVKQAIDNVNFLLRGNIREHVLTPTQISELNALLGHLNNAHSAAIQAAYATYG